MELQQFLLSLFLFICVMGGLISGTLATGRGYGISPNDVTCDFNHDNYSSNIGSMSEQLDESAEGSSTGAGNIWSIGLKGKEMKDLLTGSVECVSKEYMLSDNTGEAGFPWAGVISGIFAILIIGIMARISWFKS